MNELFDSAYGMIASFAAAVAMFWGLCKALSAFGQWCKRLMKKRQERLALPEKMMTAINNIDNKVAKQNEALDKINAKITIINERLNENDESTATLMLQKMMESYHYYVLGKRQIPLDTQTALCVMFDQYKKNKAHNHVPEDFKSRIMECKVVGVK